MTTRIKTVEESLRGPVTAEEIADLERILQETRIRGDGQVGYSNLLFRGHPSIDRREKRPSRRDHPGLAACPKPDRLSSDSGD